MFPRSNAPNSSSPVTSPERKLKMVAIIIILVALLILAIGDDD